MTELTWAQVVESTIDEIEIRNDSTVELESGEHADVAMQDGQQLSEDGSPTQCTQFIGMDFGVFQSVLSVSTASTPHNIEVVVNPMSNRATPSIVSFAKGSRWIGEAAENYVMSNPNHTFARLDAFFTTSKADLDKCLSRAKWRLSNNVDFKSQNSKSAECVNLMINLSSDIDSISGLYANSFFVSQCLRQVYGPQNSQRQEQADSQTIESELAKSSICFAVPSYFSQFQMEMMRRICECIGLVRYSVIHHDEALRLYWKRRHIPSIFTDMSLDLGSNSKGVSDETMPKLEGIIVGFVDFGFSGVSVCFMEVTEKTSESRMLSRVVSNEIGVLEVVSVLLNDGLRELESLYGSCIHQWPPKTSWRLGLQFTKLLKDLSGLSNSSVEIEGLLPNDVDHIIHRTRTEFETLCVPLQETFSQLLQHSIQIASETAGINILEAAISNPNSQNQPKKFVGIELVGGGTRIPWVQKIISHVLCQDEEDLSLIRKTLDGSSSVSYGATIKAADCDVSSNLSSPHEDKEKAAMLCPLEIFQEWERQLKKRDDNIVALHSARNELESYLFSRETAIKEKPELFGSNIQEVEKYLSLCSNWLFQISEDDDESYETYKSSLHVLRHLVDTLSVKYDEAVAGRKQTVEREIDTIASMKEKPTDDGGDRLQNVTLPVAKRINLAVKNKDEANELFKGGSYDISLQRYTLALSHCRKATEGNPEEMEQLKEIEFTCHLNAAQAHISLNTDDSYKLAVQSATAALKLKSDSLKGYFRRGLAYEKLKMWDDAKQDFSKALEIEANNKLCLQAKERVQQQIKVVEARQKQMYSRMMGATSEDNIETS